MPGRDALVARLCEVVRRPPVVVLISGAAGMGKSWLVERVVAEATPEPGVLVGCRGLPAEPFVLVREVITGVLEAGWDRDLASRGVRAIDGHDEYAVCLAMRELLRGATVVVEDVEGADTESRRV